MGREAWVVNEGLQRYCDPGSLISVLTDTVTVSNCEDEMMRGAATFKEPMIYAFNYE